MVVIKCTNHGCIHCDKDKYCHNKQMIDNSKESVFVYADECIYDEYERSNLDDDMYWY